MPDPEHGPQPNPQPEAGLHRPDQDVRRPDPAVGQPDQSVRLDTGERQVARRVVVAAPVSALFDLVADPHRHGEVDGSGTVHAAVSGPRRLALGERFSVRMSAGPVPYRITSTVTVFESDRVIEWRHPLGHRWRWEFEAAGEGRTQVTETWDYRASRAPRLLELAGFPRANGSGIKRTLDGLARRFAG